MKLKRTLLITLQMLIGLSLLGCNNLPEIQQLQPQKIPLGEAATLTLQLDSKIGGAHIAVRPNHLTIKSQQQLDIQPSALLILNNGAQLFPQGNTLLLQQEQHLLSQLKLPGIIQHIALSENTLLIADNNQQLYRVSIDHQQLKLSQQWSLPHPVDHLGAYFAASRQGELSLLNNQNVQHYTLPTPYQAIACVPNHCYLATPQGVEIIKFNASKPSQKMGLFSVAGAVNDLKIIKQNLYLAGAMGFTILDISQPKAPQWLASNNKFGPADKLVVGEQFSLLRNAQGRYHLIDTQMPMQPIWQSSFNGPIESPFALHKTHAWWVDDRQLQKLDLTNATLPTLNHSGINLGGSRRVQLRDNTLYVADWFSGLHRYDVSNPTSPRHSGNVHTPGSAKGVWLDGHYIYVGDDDHGLQVVDLNTLQVVHEVPTTGLAYTMDRVGDLLYLADHRGGFHLIDISEPEAAAIVGSHDTPQKVWSIQAYKNFALVTDDQSGVLIFDVSDPAQPRQVAQYQPGGFAEDIIVQGDLAYVAFFDDGLHILDISNPLQPTQLGYLPTPGNARGLYLKDNLLYIADWYAGLQIIDISDPRQPQWQGGLDTQGATWGIVVNGQYAYIMDWWGGIQTADISNPQQPRLLTSYHAQDTIVDIALNKGYAYLAAGKGGLQVFDINNSQGPIWTTALNLSGKSNQIVIKDATAYISHHPGGISVVDISDPFYAKLISQHSFSQSIKQLTLQGKRLLALDSTGHLSTWQAPPGKPLQQASTHPSTEKYQALGNSDHWPLVINSQGGVELLDPQNLHTLSTLPGNFQQVRLARETLYALSDQQLFIAQLHDTHIQPVSRWALNQPIHDMQLKENMLYLSGDESVLALDVSLPNQPTLQYIYPRSNQAGAIAIGNGALFAAGDSLLATTPLLPSIQQQHDPQRTTLTLPFSYPLGRYDLVIRDNTGAEQHYQNAFSVEMPKGKRVTFTLEDLKKMIKEQKGVPTQP